MTDLPPPPVPDDLDLRPFQDMPLEVTRLINSEIAAHPDAEVFRINVLSWCRAWHQVPAGSLPSDDPALARLFGFGRDLKGWKRLRAAGSLRGWVEHADGRLYHAVVVKKAMASKAFRDRAAAKREADAERMCLWREAKELKDAESRASRGDVTRDVTRSVTRDVAALSRLRAERSGAELIGAEPLERNPASPPSSGISPREGPAPHPAAGDGVRQRISGLRPDDIRDAVTRGDLVALLRAYGCNMDRGRKAEWIRDCNGLVLGEVVVVLHCAMCRQQAIREPSGFRVALADWKAEEIGLRREIGAEIIAKLGLEVPATVGAS